MEPLDLAGQQALMKEKRNTWVQANPQGIHIMRSFAPGHVQYGCCACIPAPKICPALGAFGVAGYRLCTPPVYIRQLIAASKFIHVTENGLLWNFADMIPRDECYGLPCNLCDFKAGDNVTFLPWDNPSWDRISVSRYCACMDWLTTSPLGFCCQPETCSTFWAQKLPCIPNAWPCKVCHIEGCDERRQFCYGGVGTEIKLTQLWCGGHCIKTIHPGCAVCQCLVPVQCVMIARLMGCIVPNDYSIYVRPEDYQEFVSFLKTSRDERLKVIQPQAR